MAALRRLGLILIFSMWAMAARGEPVGAGPGALDPLVESLDTPAAAIVRRVSDGAEWTGGGARVDARFVPASTFKIANSIIILEAGIIDDPDSDTIAWDGVRRGPGWDQDQTLRSAFQRSAVWAYSRLAGQVGHGTIARRLAAFGYGDEHVGPPGQVGRFWLTGPLSITAREQVGFLSRLHARTLPVDPTILGDVIDIMEMQVRPGWTLRGKTGWGQPKGTPEIGWFVGWLETDRDTWVFAVNLEIRGPERHLPLRRALAGQVLAAVGAYPELADD